MRTRFAPAPADALCCCALTTAHRAVFALPFRAGLVTHYDHRMTAEQPPSGEQWLTYADAADRLGLTLEAIRSLARRQHWPRRSPNAVGGQTWIVVPADRLAAGPAARLTLSANGHADSGHRTPPASGRRAHSEETTPANGQNANGHRTPPAAP